MKKYSKVVLTGFALAVFASSCAHQGSSANNRSTASKPATWSSDVPLPSGIDFSASYPTTYNICDLSKYSTTVEVLKACNDAMNSARNMAQYFGGGSGRVQGYLYAFSWAMQTQAQESRNDPDEAQNARNIVASLGDKIESGAKAGVKDAVKSADTNGTKDASNRYEAILNTYEEPDSSLNVTMPPYSGISDGFQRMQKELGLNYKDPEAVLHDEIPQEVLQQFNVNSFYDASYLSYMGPKKSYFVYDFWFDDGLYPFEYQSIYDSSAAFNLWASLKINETLKYTELSSKKVQKINPDTKQPIVDANGNPVYYNLQTEIFQPVFKDAYTAYLMYEYPHAFTESVQLGEMAGKLVGKEVGKRMSFYNNLVASFNDKFKQSSINAYKEVYTDLYTDAFNKRFQYLSNHAEITSVLNSVKDEVDDGIYQAGERVAVQFTSKNLGAVSSTMEATLGGDVVGSSKQNFSIAKLVSNKSYTTDFLGKIDPKKKPRDVADISLFINGGFVGSSNQTIHAPVQIEGLSARPFTNDGRVDVEIDVKNMSTKQSGEVLASIAVNGALMIKDQSLGVLTGNKPKVSVLNLTGLDPIKIMKGELKVDVIISVNGIQLDERSGVINDSNVDNSATTYFHQLANGVAYVPAGQDPQNKINEAMSLVVDLDISEMRRFESSKSNVWKKSPGQTIVGKLQMLHNSSSSSAQKYYDTIAQALYSEDRNVKGGIFSSRRKHYRRIVRSLTDLKLK